VQRLALRAGNVLRRTRPTWFLWDYVAVIAATGVLVALVAVVWRTAGAERANRQTTGLLPLLQAQAVSLLSLAALAGAAYLWYRLTHLQARRTYLARCERGADASSTDERAMQPLATTIVGQLRDVRPPRSALVVTDDPDVGAALLARVTRAIATGQHWTALRLLPVTVDVSKADGDTSVPALVQESFVRLFTDASADRPRAERLLRRAMRRHRVVALLSGLDRVAEERSEAFRRRVIAAVLHSCLDERLLFVSAVPAELVTPMSDVAVLRELPATVAGQAKALVQRVAAVVPVDQQTLTADVMASLPAAAPLSRWEARLAGDVVVLLHRGGMPLHDALVAALTEHDPDLRQIGWMKRLTEDAVEHREDGTPVARALTALGVAAHYRQELTVPEDVLRDQGPAGLDLDLGLWRLARRGVVSTSSDDGTTAPSRTVRFTRPEWFSFAGAQAIGLEPGRWRWLLRPEVSQATLAALTMATAAADPPPARSPVALLAGLREGRTDDLTLEMITAATRGLRRHRPMDLGPGDLEVLERAWAVSSQPARLAFIGALEPDPGLAAFCWGRALPTGGRYAVRRAATRRLAAMGEPAWLRMRSGWVDLVTAAEAADLRDTSRSADAASAWVCVARPFATLGWTLPSLCGVLEPPYSDDALELLHRMVSRVTRPVDGELGAPDAGLEISLAEGIKLASGVTARSVANAAALVEQGRTLFSAARAWSTKVVLLQGVGLAGGVTPTGVDVDAVAANEDEHPFVREAAMLTARHRTEPGDEDIWLDDVQSLQDGGLELSDQAHRLLALTTLLINLAERQARPSDVPVPEGLRRRTAALTGRELPRCFVRAGHTATMFQAECDCPFRLCGPKVTGTIGDRRFSAAFAQRAEATTASRPLTPGRPFVTRGFSRVWRREEVLRDVDEQVAGGR
jgi:hypothetical protein